MSGDRVNSGQVCILMGVFNGAQYLEDQLQSLQEQTHTDWVLLASDDGSTDDSCAILERFAQDSAVSGRNVVVMEGPRRGLAANFLSLIQATPENARFLAISDQDDVWLPGKLDRAIAALADCPSDVPALYCSRSWVVDDQLHNPRLSRDYPKPPGFQNALLQNIAGGNTILLNPAGIALARAAASEVMHIPGLPMHDWWLYQLITGAGGRAVFDKTPTLYYRQHANNQVGANDGWRASLHRLKLLLQGEFTDWNTANVAALQASSARLTPKNRQILQDFAALRSSSLPKRFWRFRRLGLYRQSWPAQGAMWLSLLLGRI